MGRKRKGDLLIGNAGQEKSNPACRRVRVEVARKKAHRENNRRQMDDGRLFVHLSLSSA
jgi:hypothetical protein